jgi:hypothetical protein
LPRSSLFAPRIWIGMAGLGWFRMLLDHGCRVNLKLLPVALAVCLYKPLFWVFAGLARLASSLQMRNVKIAQPPIFILGHWRSGTTLLHELMVLDQRHGCPSTYACLVPQFFMYTEDFARRFLSFILPANRPMDNMQAGWDKPQEDEFAILNLGLPSPYQSIAFPNDPPPPPEFLTIDGLPPAEVSRWKSGLMRFLNQVQFANGGKRLVLKSPTHTARVKTLLEMFPDARFVHIVRDPYVVFPSTVHLWKTLYIKHGLQVPTFAGLEEQVLDTFTTMYDRYEDDRKLIPAGNLCEIKYEDLVRDPLTEMQTIYERLGLDAFEQVVPRLKDYLSATDGYQTNKYELSDELRQRISERWRAFIEKYGYDAN